MINCQVSGTAEHRKGGQPTVSNGHIGHGAVLHGCNIGTNALVGMNAVVMDDAVIGGSSIIGAAAFVAAFPEDLVVIGSEDRLRNDAATQ